MAKIWKVSHPIPWLCDEDQQDFFAAIGDYRLRVEQMGPRSWWWRVTFQEEPIPTYHNEITSCRANAINLAEGVYSGHKVACNEFKQSFLSKIIQENDQQA